LSPVIISGKFERSQGARRHQEPERGGGDGGGIMRMLKSNPFLVCFGAEDGYGCAAGRASVTYILPALWSRSVAEATRKGSEGCGSSHGATAAVRRCRGPEAERLHIRDDRLSAGAGANSAAPQSPVGHSKHENVFCKRLRGGSFRGSLVNHSHVPHAPEQDAISYILSVRMKFAATRHGDII
jgi:hypothetical protein